MADVPAALLRIHPLPDGVISLLREVAEGGGDPTSTTLDILHRDEGWLREVETVLRATSMPQNGHQGPVLDGLALPEIAVATAVQRYMRNCLISAELQRYWHYSLACGLACAELSRCTAMNANMAFSCGLLHDLGRLALMTTYPDQYANLFAKSERMFGRNEVFNVAEQERLLFGFDRFQTGEWLVDEWGLSPFYRQIVGKFHTRELPATNDMVGLTRIGCSVVYALGYGLMLGAPRRTAEDLRWTLPPCFVKKFGSGLDELKVIINTMLEKWPTFAN
jgi:hypothetical protein